MFVGMKQKSNSFINSVLSAFGDYRLAFDLSRLPIGGDKAAEYIRAYDHSLRAYQTVMGNEQTGAATIIGMAMSNMSVFVTGAHAPQDWKSFSEIVRLGRDMYREVKADVPFNNEIDIKSAARIEEACDDFIRVANSIPDDVYHLLDRRTGASKVEQAFMSILPRESILVLVPEPSHEHL
jgi:hypothetical protein